MKKLLLVLLSMAMLYSCSLGKEEEEKEDTRRELIDGNGDSIGYVLSADSWVISFLTPEGYLLKIDWGGNIIEEVIYFTEPQGGGTPFIEIWASSKKVHPKRVFKVNSNYYTFQIGTDGYAKKDNTITDYASYYFEGEILDDDYYFYTVINPDKVYPMVILDRSLLDYPDKVVGPLTISYK